MKRRCPCGKHLGLFVVADYIASAAAQVGADTVFTYDENSTITLLNVALASLGADDFAFV